MVKMTKDNALFKVSITEGSAASYRVEKKATGDEGELWVGTYKEIISVACKLLKKDISDSYRNILRDETNLLSKVSHTNIVRLINFEENVQIQVNNAASKQTSLNEKEIPDEKRSVLVMEGISGFDLSKMSEAGKNNIKKAPFFNENGSLNEERFLQVLEDLTSAISYLHKLHIMHMDIKPSNIMFDEERDRIVLIDLGFALILSEGDKKERLGENVLISFTKEYAEKELLNWYNKKNPAWNNTLRISIIKSERRELNQFFPSHDLYALGKTIEEILEYRTNTTEARSIKASLSPNIRKGLELITSELIATPTDKRDVDASKIQDQIHRLIESVHPPFGVPELWGVTGSLGKIIQLPVGIVRLSPRLSRIVNLPIVQRMRLIQQLDLLRFVYPGATYTRFVHSLLTYEYARRAMISLLADSQFALQVKKTDIEAFLLYALLHDIGHYPLSHMLEDLHKVSTNKDSEAILVDDDLFDILFYAESNRKYRYEEKNVKKLTELKKYVEDIFGGNQSLKNVIEEEFGKEVIARIIEIWKLAQYDEPSNNTDPILGNLAGLISSPIDVDKLSYLVLDSNASGVPYGKSLDIDRFLDSLIFVPQLNKWETIKVVGIDSHGIAAAEAVIISRYWNFSTIYWHHTNRAIMAMFNFVLKLIISEQNSISFTDFFKAVTGPTEQKNPIDVDESSGLNFLVEKFNTMYGSDELYINPLTEIVGGKRGIYKRIVTIPFQVKKKGEEQPVLAPPSPENIPSITSDLREVIESEIQWENKNIEGLIKYDGEKNKRLKEGVVLLDIPKANRESKEEKSVVVFSNGGTNSVYLNEASPLLTDMQKEMLTNAKKIRVFVHPKLENHLKANSKLDSVISKISKSLENSLKK